jgi:UDP-N-acetylmuramoyl-tripeptide--D-alanyl-D-alanine ligase
MDSKLFALYDLYLRHSVVATDSRQVTPGALFFALRGERFDGNAYAAAALEAGAAVAVVDDPKAAADERYVVVPDTLKALQALARHHRRELAIPVLAITGSNGKTTTKELASRVLARRFRTASTRGNLNNHIGVPLTLLAIPPDAEFAVVEMGANHRGEIAAYCAVAEPDYGLITNIGKAHLEGFGGPEGIRRGKGELLDWLARTDGTAFCPVRDETLLEMAAERPGLNVYGYSADALETMPSENGLLTLRLGERTIRTRLAGDYNRANVAAALAVGQFFEVDPAAAVEAVESYAPDNLRSQRVVTPHNILYIDAYNANPSSLSAALENFAAVDEPGYSKALILGDMLELGGYAASEHRAILERAASAGFDEVYLVGAVFSAIGGARYKTFPDVVALGEYLSAHPLAGRAILIKGSRGIGLEKIVNEL